MSDQHLEEQEMEAEALAAIFDTAFEIRSSEQPFVWAVKLVPVDCGGDADEEEVANHVMVKLIADIPLDYPEETLPRLELEIIKGLSLDNKKELLRLANEEAEANAGMPAIFAVCEAVRTWLADNNVKGLDDASLHANMMRKAKEVERREAQASQQFESQKKKEEMSQAEKEELEVRKRREEGTPVTETTFADWWDKFSAEMAQKKEDIRAAAAEDCKDKKVANAAAIMEERQTGFQIFSDKAGVFNLEKLEAAAEEMENDTSALDPEELGVVDQELFDDDDDLDDLDFDSDDDDEDSDEEPDI
mmetsp:Transcript_373/g.842  ORF Transcript_373/g.842 Transcript_373/m.842 type:complete len:304 (-) Transcript_373:1347-2258(-)|eukprot:CAMPEP_0181110368 /NCGR_PEP_ID=MMETSP1071-20121207/18680_1 /TAXON_ID=35127 /ORGANISM="Thalassiosira sp., Strain NH16" /LENGTH=303 /DNA_ID=CAMNT_0023194141 /DNA_START=42 /DNA_END=953 /DNA_ORIENTATION=+